MTKRALSPEGITYEMDDTGAIHQLDAKPYRYDSDYIARTYGSAPQDALLRTAYLRLGYLLGTIRDTPHRLLDWGYGSGMFLKAASTMPGVEAHGYEINGLPLPINANHVADPMAEKWDCVCFYDVLEHIPDISFLRELKTKYLVITVPWCSAYGMGWEWFWEWKHRKPDEHLHHWFGASLAVTLERLGYTVLDFRNPEDATRKGPDPKLPNILTVVAKKD